MYNNNDDKKDKVIDKALDELFEKEFIKENWEIKEELDSIFDRKEEEFTHTILNIPKIDTDISNNLNINVSNTTYDSIKDDIIPINNKFHKKSIKFGKNILLGTLVLILVMSLGYTLLNDKIMINGTASVQGISDISYECNIIKEGELKSSGSGSCNVNKNNITTISTLYKPTDSVNYNIIVTNKGDFPIKLVKLISSNNKNINLTNSGDEIFLNENYLSAKYAIYYNEKEIFGDRLSSNSNVILNPGESFIIIVNHNWTSTDNQPHLQNDESINYDIMMNFDQIIK